MASIPGRAILFHTMLENGAIFWRLPISSFFQRGFKRNDVPEPVVQDLELWNSFSYYPSVHSFDWLVGEKGKYLGRDKKFYYGNYLFTIDWAHPESNILDVEHSEIPQEHSVLTFSLLTTAITLLSLIIVFCGLSVLSLIKMTS
jgi:hypothetical protein